MKEPSHFSMSASKESVCGILPIPLMMAAKKYWTHSRVSTLVLCMKIHKIQKVQTGVFVIRVVQLDNHISLQLHSSSKRMLHKFHCHSLVPLLSLWYNFSGFVHPIQQSFHVLKELQMPLLPLYLHCHPSMLS